MTTETKPDTKPEAKSEPEPKNKPDKPEAKSEPERPSRLRADDVVTATNGVKSPEALDLLAKACKIYGLNPTKKLKRPEVMAWTFLAADADLGTEASIKITTGGGVKLRYPITPESEETLRRVFGAFRLDAKTRETINMPLPDDLTLPLQAVDGYPRDQRRGPGYLRGGRRTDE